MKKAKARRKDGETPKRRAQRKRLNDLYRITPEEQTVIEEYQRTHPPYDILLGGHMGVDHNHRTGLIRGRIDFRLNKAIGYIEGLGAEQAPALLRALAAYLETPPATLALGAPRYGLLGKAQYKRKMVYGGSQ